MMAIMMGAAASTWLCVPSGAMALAIAFAMLTLGAGLAAAGAQLRIIQLSRR